MHRTDHSKMPWESYLNCACIIDRDSQVFDSTNPNGENQPGFARMGWCVPPRALRVNSSEPEPNWHNRVADVVMYDPLPQMYTVVAEIKSGDDAEKGSGLEQNVEQMLGLFKDQQTIMLGLVVHNLQVAPLLLRAHSDRVTGIVTTARRHHYVACHANEGTDWDKLHHWAIVRSTSSLDL